MLVNTWVTHHPRQCNQNVIVYVQTMAISFSTYHSRENPHRIDGMQDNKKTLSRWKYDGDKIRILTSLCMVVTSGNICSLLWPFNWSLPRVLTIKRRLGRNWSRKGIQAIRHNQTLIGFPSLKCDLIPQCEDFHSCFRFFFTSNFLNSVNDFGKCNYSFLNLINIFVYFS